MDSGTKMTWNLMTDDAITSADREVLANFVRTSSRLTQGDVVLQFEKAWSKWLGCKYSIFVNSGSSANLVIVRALTAAAKQDTWVAQACTWATTVSPIMQFAKLQLCDINLDNFSPDLLNLEYIFKTQKPKFLLLTHLLGFVSLSDELLNLCKKYNVTLVEDCCEAHGAEFKGKKVGTHGVASSFSFYYGHHMTTIEGGMICTDDEDLYHEMLQLRSHGMLRTLPAKQQAQHQSDNVDPFFTFLRDGFNVRNTDFHAVLGVRQLERLDDCIVHRNKNYDTFVQHLDATKYKVDFVREGCSNFALPIFVKDGNTTQVKDKMRELGIEYRPCVAGNLFQHPFMHQVKQLRFEENAQQVHEKCMYVGNHKDVTPDMVKQLCKALNSL